VDWIFLIQLGDDDAYYEYNYDDDDEGWFTGGDKGEKGDGKGDDDDDEGWFKGGDKGEKGDGKGDNGDNDWGWFKGGDKGEKGNEKDGVKNNGGKRNLKRGERKRGI